MTPGPVTDNVTRRGSLYSCVFCGGTHFNKKFEHYLTTFLRKQITGSLGRSFISLPKGYIFKDCPNIKKQVCQHCKTQDITIEQDSGHHNWAICPQHHTKQSKPEATAVVSESYGTPRARSHSDSGNWQSVLLQTETVTVHNTEASTRSQTRILLDVEESSPLPSPPHVHDSRVCKDWGKEALTESETYLVGLDISLEYDSRLPLEANILKQITRPIQRVPVHQSDLEFLKSVLKGNLADSTPNKTQWKGGHRYYNWSGLLLDDDWWRRNNATIWNAVTTIRIRLGYTLTGKYPDPQTDNVGKKDMHSFVMTQVNQPILGLSFYSKSQRSCYHNIQIWRVWMEPRSCRNHHM